jgi:hypothetical protein
VLHKLGPAEDSPNRSRIASPPTQNQEAGCGDAKRRVLNSGVEEVPRATRAFHRLSAHHSAKRSRRRVSTSFTPPLPSRSTYCLKGPSKRQQPRPRLPGAKESTWRLPAAVRLPKASCPLCSCARGPSRPVASAGTGTSSTGRTRSMASAWRVRLLKAALPAPCLSAILAWL